jgi:hypothetical protein
MTHPIAGDPRRGEEHAGHLDDCSHEECKRASHASRAAVRRAAGGGPLQWAVAPIEQADGTIVNLGDVLGEVSKACNDVAANLQPGSTMPESCAAFMRLGRTFAAAAKALGKVNVFVPKEPW